MNPIEITRKIREVAKNHGLETPSFSILIYYNQYKEAVYMEEGDSTTQEIKKICQRHLFDTLECPTCYPDRTIYPCRTIENTIRIYSTKWINGIIVLASSSDGFMPQTFLDETIKQLRIGKGLYVNYS